MIARRLPPHQPTSSGAGGGDFGVACRLVFGEAGTEESLLPAGSQAYGMWGEAPHSPQPVCGGGSAAGSFCETPGPPFFVTWPTEPAVIA